MKCQVVKILFFNNIVPINKNANLLTHSFFTQVKAIPVSIKAEIVVVNSPN